MNTDSTILASMPELAHSDRPATAGATAAPDYSLVDILKILWRHKVLMLVLPAALGLLGYLASLTLPNTYRSTVLLAVTTQTPTALLKEVADSDGVRVAVSDQLRLMEHYRVADPLEFARLYRSRLSTRVLPRDAGALSISATDTDPAFAARLAEAVARETIAAAHRSAITVSSVALAKLEARLKQIEANAAAGAEGLSKAGIKDWRSALPPSDSLLLSLMANLQADINLAGADPAVRENSTVLLQTPIAILLQQLSGRTSLGTAVPFDRIVLIKEQYYYEALKNRLIGRAELARTELANEIRFAGPPPLPLTRESPNRLVILLASAVLGLALAVVIILLRSLVDQRDRR